MAVQRWSARYDEESGHYYAVAPHNMNMHKREVVRAYGKLSRATRRLCVYEHSAPLRRTRDTLHAYEPSGYQHTTRSGQNSTYLHERNDALTHYSCSVVRWPRERSDFLPRRPPARVPARCCRNSFLFTARCRRAAPTPAPPASRRFVRPAMSACISSCSRCTSVFSDRFSWSKSPTSKPAGSVGWTACSTRESRGWR